MIVYPLLACARGEWILLIHFLHDLLENRDSHLFRPLPLRPADGQGSQAPPQQRLELADEPVAAQRAARHCTPTQHGYDLFIARAAKGFPPVAGGAKAVRPAPQVQ